MNQSHPDYAPSKTCQTIFEIIKNKTFHKSLKVALIYIESPITKLNDSNAVSNDSTLHASHENKSFHKNRCGNWVNAKPLTQNLSNFSKLDICHICIFIPTPTSDLLHLSNTSLARLLQDKRLTSRGPTLSLRLRIRMSPMSKIVDSPSSWCQEKIRIQRIVVGIATQLRSRRA